MRKLLCLIGAAALVGFVTPASAQMNMGRDHASAKHGTMHHRGMMSGMMKRMRGHKGRMAGGMCPGCTTMCECCKGIKRG